MEIIIILIIDLHLLSSQKLDIFQYNILNFFPHSEDVIAHCNDTRQDGIERISIIKQELFPHKRQWVKLEISRLVMLITNPLNSIHKQFKALYSERQT